MAPGELSQQREKDSEEGSVNVPLWKVWALLRPTWATVRKGETEVVAMLGVCLARAIEVRFTTDCVRILDSTLTSRNIATFQAGLVRYGLVSFVGSWLRIGYGYLQARLTWKWRKKLTDTLQAEYFRGINYYLIGEGGARGADRMHDADTRITEDLRQTIDGFARSFSDGMFSTITGFFYTVETFRVFGYKFALAPYAYLFFSFVIVDFLAPVMKTWRRNGRNRGQSWADYRFQLTRLGLQAESVASLKGVAYEHKIIRETYAQHRHDILVCDKAFFKFGIVNCFFMHHFMDQFTAIFCIGRGILFPMYERLDTIEKMSTQRSMVGVQWVLFNNTMNAAKTTIELIRTLQQLVGNVERVTDLIELLRKVRETKTSELASAVTDGDAIAFESVDIYTPADVLLVKDLSFRLEIGQSLLLTGHNGAGKSSIFRCLGGLWKIPKGRIIRPGGATGSTSGLNQTVFYIPQKPYNVIGTLQDQMTYPDTSGAEELTKERLLDILHEVNLEHLVSREGALTDEINWEDELSLGEKQRLAIARLLHHKPRYAILDECSSAISAEMERRLYRICAEHKITYITIAHRPALRAYHDLMLAIGDGKQGWSMTSINREDAMARTLEMAKRSVVSEGEEKSIQDHMDARSKPYSDGRNLKPMPVRPMLGRFLRLCRIGYPDWMIAKLIGLATLIGVQTLVEDYTFQLQGSMLGALMAMDKVLMLRLVCNATVAALAQGVIWESMLFIQREAGADMAQKIENNLFDRYCANNNFYIMSQLDGRIKDGEHRITDDIHGLFHWALSDVIIGGLRPLSKLIWFTYRIGGILGFRWPLGIWAYMLFSVFCLKQVMPDYSFLSREGSRLDARFKFVHARVKTCAESIAFFGGGEREHQIVNNRFDRLMAHDWLRLKANCKFQIVEDVFRNRIPDLLQWVLRFSYGYLKGGTDAEIVADSGAQLNANQQQLVLMNGMIFGELGVLIGLTEKFATVGGKTQRIAEFQEVLDEIEAEHPHPSAAGPVGDKLVTKLPLINDQRQCTSNDFYLQEAWPECAGAHVNGDADTELDHKKPRKIEMRGVDLVTPRGVAIATNVSCEVTEDTSKSLMISGRNASGKTSFVRVLAGLWPHSNGELTAPAPRGSTVPGLKDIFIVPQRIHMCLGSLADQLTYPGRIPPEQRTADQEARLMKLLELVGIAYLVKRWAGDSDDVVKDAMGLDHVTRWEDVLSLGEQQRLSLARMFYHAPTFGVLDECTSAVSVDVEETLYKSAIAQGITCITVSQRLSLPEFHSHELKMGENNEHGQTLRVISADDAADANLRDGRHVAADIASMYQASGNERTG